MKRIFIFLIISILILLRFSFSTRRAIFQKNEIHNILLDLDESRATILKVNNKYPLKYISGRLFYKEDGRYEGYFLIENIKEEDNFTFLELKEIKSEKIEKNLVENYLNKVFIRSQEDFSPDLKNMNKAILIGENKISKKMKEKIRYLGLSHIFAMSGLHIGIVFSIFYYICFRMFNKKFFIELATLVFLILYYLGVKESPSFSRAFIMLIIYLLAKILYEKVNVEKTLIASAIISMLMKPNVIFSLSFQLSYLAMFAIIYFYPILRKINVKNWKILDYVLFTVSIQLFLIPIQVYYFGTIPFFSIFVNILILPLAGIYITTSYIHLFLENFYLSFILNPIIKLIYKIFENFINIFSKIPNSTINFQNDKLIYFYLFFFIIIIIKKYYYKPKI